MTLPKVTAKNDPRVNPRAWAAASVGEAICAGGRAVWRDSEGKTTAGCSVCPLLKRRAMGLGPPRDANTASGAVVGFSL